MRTSAHASSLVSRAAPSAHPALHECWLTAALKNECLGGSMALTAPYVILKAAMPLKMRDRYAPWLSVAAVCSGALHFAHCQTSGRKGLRS